jgi:serine/threonine-protein kinase
MAETRLPPDALPRLRRVFLEEDGRGLGRLAVRRGFLTERQLEEATRDAGGQALGDVLVGRGWLRPEDRADLEAELLREGFVRQAPPGVRALEGDPSRRLGEYVLVAPLGEGGAADVWKAWDLKVGRWVAVKVPRLGPQPGAAAERFRREAQALARLAHPNIVPVYAVSEDRGRPFLVLRFVEGRPLGGARLPARRAAELLCAAARAVQHAHEQGVVHRDLKPANLLVDEAGWVWVIDFGLVHLLEEEARLTATGAVLGTAAYMSPEQARGEPSAKAPASDVYGLGATLYELVTGAPPFEGATFGEIVRKVREAEPVLPRKRNPSLDRDLETLILKAMDKDPARRYASAGALAKDLENYLQGEAIEARPAGAAYRLYRRVRKYPARAAAVVAAAAALAFWAAGSRSADRLAAEREVAVRMMREAARLSMEAALEHRRRGENREMRKYLPRLEGAHRAAVERAPDLAEVDYLLGRMYRALMDDGRALEFQERALRKEPAYAPALYERAVLLSKRYGRELRRALDARRASEVGPDAARTVSLPEAERMRPALADLRRRIVSDAEALGRLVSNEVTAAAARGILAYHLGRHAEAESVLREVVARDDRLEEAWETLARSAYAQAGPASRPEDRERHWTEAELWFGRGLSVDRGYLPLLLGRSEVRADRAIDRWMRGRDPLPDCTAAEVDLDRALALDDGIAETWLRRGVVRCYRGMYRVSHRGTSLDDYDQADADFTEALRRDPEGAEALRKRAMVRSLRGVRRGSLSADPGADYAAAEADFREAERRDPASPELWIWWGFKDVHVSVDRGKRGGDVFGPLDAARRKLDEALRLNPDSARAWRYRAHLWTVRAVHRRYERKEDVLDDYDRAERDLDEAVRLEPESWACWKARGEVLSTRGRYRQERGGDPMSDWRRSEADLTRAVELYPDYGDTWYSRADLRAALGDARARAGARAEAAQDYRRAAEDYREAARRSPTRGGDAEARTRELLEKAGRATK